MKSDAKTWGKTLAVGIVIVLFIYPIIHMLLMSFKLPKELFTHWFVFRPTLQNYLELFRKIKVGTFLLNSVIVAMSSAGLSLLLGTIAAYSFARNRFLGRKFLLFLVLFIRMMPPAGALVPLFLMMNRWGLTDTFTCLILLYTAFQTPFVIWMMKGFFDSIPSELEEAATIDGCTKLGAFFRILIPLSAPGLVATSIFAFTLSWNEFLFALIFTSAKTKTIPVVVPELIGEMGIFWGQICGAGTLALLPIVLFSFLVQKHLISGLSFGAVKG